MVAQERSATQFTFPLVRTAQQVARLVEQFDRLDGWRAIRLGEDDGIVRIGLRCRIDDEHVAWVLGFAPIETMAITRRAPFTAVIMRTQASYDSDRNDETPNIDVHLADLCPAHEIDPPMWVRTIARRAAMVEADKVLCAKAKVTFALPSDLLPDDFGLMTE